MPSQTHVVQAMQYAFSFFGNSEPPTSPATYELRRRCSIAAAGAQARDWKAVRASAQSIAAFNRDWSRCDGAGRERLITGCG
jgi:hypothetical protein